jgi:hypothetical protein
MDAVRTLADTVLYEGYILWPYRRSALKNQKRWTFGGIFPPSHSEEHPDDRAELQAQCLVEGDVGLDVRVRFLHVVERALVNRDGNRVGELEVAGERYLAWDEAVEREFVVGPGTTVIEIAAGTDVESLPDEAGRILRTWAELRGRIAVAVEPLAEQLRRITVRLRNETAWQGSDREDALRQTFCSAHLVLRTERGAFVSQTDPPDEHRAAAADCINVGVWPVLVGEEGDRSTVLAAPIILADYPKIAPESPGDLFDAGEIDRLLILNVLSLSASEQEEMRATDPRAREILDRCTRLGPEELLPLHGAIRDFRPAADA